MARRSYKRYFTKDKKAKINKKNTDIYNKYLTSNIIKNKDVADTTYKTYKNYFEQFLVYISEEQENICILDEEFIDNAVDILEGFIMFCQTVLGNNKKVINTKLSSISSFFHWCAKRGNIPIHPFDGKLERMKNSNEEVIMSHYFLNEEQIETISDELYKSYEDEDKEFDMQDLLIWHITLDSANRNGAISKLKWSKLDWANRIFHDIREKRGYLVEVPFSKISRKFLLEWKKMREDSYDFMECDYIFIAKKNGEYKGMSTTSIYNRVKKIGTIIGLKDFHPHCIRKTTINRIAKVDITLAQEYANHKDIGTTTKHYVEKKSKTEIREKINALMEQQEK